EADQSPPEKRFSLPMDLTGWIEKETLLAWTVEEVERLNWANPELVTYLRANPAFQPKVLLCLLTYSYASGSFASEEISRNFDAPTIRHDLGGKTPVTIASLVKQSEIQAALRSLQSTNPPTANTIKRFRRENRGLLKWCLAQVFKRAVKV